MVAVLLQNCERVEVAVVVVVVIADVSESKLARLVQSMQLLCRAPVNFLSLLSCFQYGPNAMSLIVFVPLLFLVHSLFSVSKFDVLCVLGCESPPLTLNNLCVLV